MTVGGKQTYGCVNMSDFLDQLAAKLEPNPTSLKNFRRMYTPKGLHQVDSKSPLETSVLYDRVQVNFAEPEHHAPFVSLSINLTLTSACPGRIIL